MKSNLIKLIKHMAILLFGSALIGTLLLVLVFCLPTGTIQKHVAQSLDDVLPGKEEHIDNAFVQYIRANKESYTDSIMVQYAFEKIPGKNAFEHAMWAYHHDFEEEIWAAEDSLRAVAGGADTSRMYLREYSRYWHGYLVYLKPLLLVFSWSQLVWVGVTGQLFLTACVGVAAWRRKCPEVLFVVAAGLFFMKPALMLVSLTMSVCMVITMAALFVLLHWREWLESRGVYPEYFFCIGILTAYFDFLTYPVVTLGLPLCVCFLLSERERVSASFGRLFGYSACWGLGYAGMWAFKWLIADATLHTGTIRDAVWNVLGRTEAIGGHGIAARVNGGIHVLALNLHQYDRGSCLLVLLLLAGVLFTAFTSAVRRKVTPTQLWQTVFPYLVTALIPFAWIVAVQHHSALHARFTFRIIGVSTAAVAACAVKLWKTGKPKNNENTL